MKSWIEIILCVFVLNAAAKGSDGGQTVPVVRIGETVVPLAFNGEDPSHVKKDSVSVEIAENPIERFPEAREYIAQIKGGEAGVFLGVRIGKWNPKNFVLAPGAVYNSNNFFYQPMRYPPLWRDKKDFDPNQPTTIAKTGTPRLTPPDHSHPSSRIKLIGGDTSAVLIGVWEPESKTGTIVLADQSCGNGRLVDFDVKVDESTHTAVILAGVQPGRDKHLQLRIRVFHFPASELQALYDMVFRVRKQISIDRPVNVLPFSAAFDFVHDLYQNERWSDELELFRVSDQKNGRMNMTWQLGWIGGGMITLPLLMQGTPDMQALCKKTLEMTYSKAQAPSGFFYTMRDGSGKFYSEGFGKAHPHDMTMVRKQGDWLYWSLKHFQLLEQRKDPVPENWQAGTRKLADAFVSMWKRYGQFGQFVNVETGELQVGRSCAGAVVPAGLALAAEYFNHPDYLDVAEQSAEAYDRDYVRKGITTGGPGEILSAPDSESAFAMLESFVVLYEATGEVKWMDAASRMAAQCSTWVHANDFPFPKESEMGRVDARSTGAVWASVVNRHGAPAICTLSGDSLFRLWRASSDPLVLELARDIAHGTTQYLCVPGRQLGKMPVGGICERVNTSRWEGEKGLGGNIFGSCGWVETALLATCTEFPGLYVQPDTGFFQVFDHIVAEPVSHEKGRLALRLKNPTVFPAEVSVFSENSTQVKQKLSRPLLMDRTIRLAPGEEKTICFD